MKKKSPAEELKSLAADIETEIKRWNVYFTQGGQDPTWPDGCNMNLIRNHIIYDKMRIDEISKEHGLEYPQEYDYPTPQEVENSFMARSDEIRANALKSLAVYEADPDYQYLLRTAQNVDDKLEKETCLRAVLGYVTGLRDFIETDRLVDMRRHERSERYLDSFRECAARLQAALTRRNQQESVQLSLFDLVGW